MVMVMVMLIAVAGGDAAVGILNVYMSIKGSHSQPTPPFPHGLYDLQDVLIN